MALYDAPVSRGYQVLTHPSAGRAYAKNGYAQVGNTTFPTNPISANRVVPSAIYNKGIAGLSEAGYGQRYPNPPGLSSARAYRPGLRGLSAPGSRISLRDAYINDNPPPGTLRGLSDDVSTAVDTGTVEGPPVPPPTTTDSVWSSITGDIGTAVSNIFGSGAAAASAAASSAIQGAVAPKPTPVQTAISSVKSALPTTVLGMSIDTVLLLGAGVGVYFYMKKR